MITIECDACGRRQDFESVEGAALLQWRLIFGNVIEKIDLCDGCSHLSVDQGEQIIMEQNIRVKAEENDIKSIDRGSITTLELDLPKVIVEAPGGARSLVRVKGISIHKGKVLVTVQK